MSSARIIVFAVNIKANAVYALTSTNDTIKMFSHLPMMNPVSNSVLLAISWPFSCSTLLRMNFTINPLVDNNIRYPNSTIIKSIMILILIEHLIYLLFDLTDSLNF